MPTLPEFCKKQVEFKRFDLDLFCAQNTETGEIDFGVFNEYETHYFTQWPRVLEFLDLLVNANKKQ